MSASPTEGDDGDPSGSFPDLPRRFVDSASGMPLSATARAALAGAWGSGWADPQRRYPSGRAARRLLDTARSSVARHFGVPTAGVFFTGGYEDAVGLALAAAGGGPIHVSAVEDLAVLRTTDLWAARGTPVTVVGVDHSGTIDPEDLAGVPGTVVVQDGNIEVGVRQPLAAVRAAAPDAQLVVDLRAVAGRTTPFDGFDIAVADPRMWGGPPGVGVVLVRDPGRFLPEVARTDGHGGIESPYPPIVLIAAAALALESADSGWERLAGPMAVLHDGVARLPDSTIVGERASQRLPYLAMATFWYVPADELVDRLAARGWATASGASCTSDTRRPQHVLTAMGASTHGSLRVSPTPGADEALLAELVADVTDVVTSIRAENGTAGL
ncbi:MAG: aminotransferase class V-fold PLP-dependent enzyme [Candidatus Nanopelagicales bacterium]